jgi:hypothetical protein
MEKIMMQTSAAPRTSLLRLFRALTGDTKTFLRQEIQLAKTEISEKLSEFGRNAAALAIGGFIAYAGSLVILIGLGCLLAWAFENAGLSPMFAAFVGLAIIGLLVALVGAAILMKGLKTLSKESLAPERTLQTLHELKGEAAAPAVPEGELEHTPAPSSAEMQARVEATENRMGETLDELGRRLSPSHINAQVKRRIQANPYQSGLIAMGAGLVSALFLKRKHRHV